MYTGCTVRALCNVLVQLRKLVGFNLSFDTRGSAEATGGREGDKTGTSRIDGQVIQS